MTRANINWLRAALFPELVEEVREQKDVATLIPVSSTSVADYPIWMRVFASFFIHIEYLLVGLVAIGISAGIAALGFDLPTRPNLIFWTLMGVVGVLYLADAIFGTIRSSPIDDIVTGFGRVIFVWLPGVGGGNIRVVGPARLGQAVNLFRLYHELMRSVQHHLNIKKELTLQIHPERAEWRVGDDVTITVTDDEGNPVEDAKVQLGDQIGSTDQDGRVEVPLLEPGSATIIARKDADNFTRYQTAEVQIPVKKKSVKLRFEGIPRRAEADSEVELNVVDKQGKPVEGAEITIDGKYVPPTDSRGQTTAYLPEPGILEIKAQKAETAGKVFEPASTIIEVGPSEIQFDEYPEEVPLGEPAYFRVTDNGGDPVSNAEIRTSLGHSVQTDDEGWASLTFEEPGMIRISALAPGFEHEDAEKIAEISVHVEDESRFWR